VTAQRPQPQETVLVVGAPIADGDAAVLCARLRALVATAGGAGTEVLLDVGDLRADVRGVDALARLALTARRCGARIRLRRASADLLALLAFCGLRGVLPLGRVEPQRQPEQREHPLDVEERVDRRDAPV
jgi:hypothetical protein